MKYTTEHNKKKTDINEHLPTLYGLVVDSKARNVLELGVRWGESTVALLEAVHQTDGRLTSVDVDQCLQARDMIGRYGMDSRWTFVQDDDLVFGAKWDRARPWDLVFVDTSHTYGHTQKEIALFEPLTRPGGIMVFHDTVSFPDGVLRPIQEFLQSHPGHIFEHHVNCNGLGIMRKPA